MPQQVDLASKPYAIEYYYRAKWGHIEEFIDLFTRNHYPVLLEQVKTGRFVSVSCVKPRYHNTEDGRWDFRVTIVFKNVMLPHSPTTRKRSSAGSTPIGRFSSVKNSVVSRFCLPIGIYPSSTAISRPL